MTRALVLLILVSLPSCAVAPPPSQRAAQAMAAKDYKAAEEAFNEYLNVDTVKDAKPWADRAYCRMQLGKFKGADDDYCVAHALDRRSEYSQGIARARAKRGDLHGAIITCALDLNNRPPQPNDPTRDLCRELTQTTPVTFLTMLAREKYNKGLVKDAKGDAEWALRIALPDERWEPERALEEFAGVKPAQQLVKGNELREKGDLRGAAAAYLKALRSQGRKMDQDVAIATGVAGEPEDVREAWETVLPAAGRLPYQDSQVKLWQTGEVDGRKLAVRVGIGQRADPLFLNGRAWESQPENDGVWGNHFFELFEVDTKTILLPMQWHRIVIVPGDGVYVLSLRERLRHEGGLRTGAVLPGLGVSDPAGAPRWRRVDLKTRLALPSDVVHLERHPGDDPLRPSILVVRHPENGALLAETVSGDGSTRKTYPSFTPISDGAYGDYHPIRITDQLRVLTTAKKQVLLASDLTPIAELSQEPLVATNGKQRYLVAPASGEDLWRILDKSGQFSAPDGVEGFRPFGSFRWKKDQPPSGLRWLAKFSQGPKPWGLAEWDFSKMSVGLWESAEVLPAPLAGQQPMYKGVNGTSSRPFSHYDYPFLLVGGGAEWTAVTVDIPNLPGVTATAAGRTREEAIEAYRKNAAAALASDLAALEAAADAERAEIAKRKAAFEAEWVQMKPAQREAWLMKNWGDVEHWTSEAFSSTNEEFLYTAWRRDRVAPQRRQAVFDRWYQISIALKTHAALKRQYLNLSDYYDSSMKDLEARKSELRRLAYEKSPEGLAAAEKKRQDAEELRAWEERRANEAELQRQEMRKYLTMPLPGGNRFSWLPPPNPSQQRYDEEAYKRGLDKVIQGKSWTPYGY